MGAAATLSATARPTTATGPRIDARRSPILATRLPAMASPFMTRTCRSTLLMDAAAMICTSARLSSATTPTGGALPQPHLPPFSSCHLRHCLTVAPRLRLSGRTLTALGHVPHAAGAATRRKPPRRRHFSPKRTRAPRPAVTDFLSLLRCRVWRTAAAATP